MGQYFYGVSIGAKEHLHAHKFDSGLKLMEHSWLENPMVNFAMELLSPFQPWNKTAIVWIGDYGSSAGKYMPDYKSDNEDGLPDSLHGYAGEHFTLRLPEDGNIDVKRNANMRYILNHTKKEFVDLNKCPDTGEGWIIHPLPLLTADGNGNGGGDYYGSAGEQYVGHWAGDVLSVGPRTYSYPDFTEIVPGFKE